jgi:hypothetical protein
VATTATLLFRRFRLSQRARDCAPDPRPGVRLPPFFFFLRFAFCVFPSFSVSFLFVSFLCLFSFFAVEKKGAAGKKKAAKKKWRAKKPGPFYTKRP